MPRHKEKGTTVKSGTPFRTAYLWTICLVAAMGGLLFGYDWVVIGGAKPFYEPFFSITDQTPFLRGFAQSSALVGCLAGALISGALTGRFGRKRMLLLSGFLFTASAVGTALAWDFPSFAAFRILGGLGIGLASNLSPMYIAEVSPADRRGKFVSINQLTIVIGIVAAQVTNWLIAQPVPPGASAGEILRSWNGTAGWRWMFGAETVPAGLFFLLMFFIPESPRWLVKAGRKKEARRILASLGGEDYAATTLPEIEESLEGEGGGSGLRELLEPDLLKIVALGVFLAVFQQWCGINVIFNYAQEVFSGAGYQVSDILFNILITGIVNLLFTFVAIRTVDRFGRRALMLLGAGGLALVYTVLGWGYFQESKGLPMLILVVTAIACYAMTLAPVTWVILSEIFPNRVRGAAMSLSVFALWAACALLTLTFPYLQGGLGTAGTFWLYGAICLGSFFLLRKKLPETKGKTLEEIERELLGPGGSRRA